MANLILTLALLKMVCETFYLDLVVQQSKSLEIPDLKNLWEYKIDKNNIPFHYNNIGL